MFQRKTQSAEYWGSEFQLTRADATYLYELLADGEVPRSTDELVLALIQHHCHLEEARIRDELSKGSLYQPKEDYEVGQRLVFPAFDFAAGTVTAKRPGSNPEHGEFSVIKVELEGRRKPREFAAALKTDHKLNSDDGGQGLLQSEELLSPAELKESWANRLEEKLVHYLLGRPEGFIVNNDKWLLRDMLTEVSIGHLNIAEALIEMASKPVSAERLLEELDLAEASSPEVRLFSLSHAMQADGRFDDLSPGGSPEWYLRRLEPETVQAVPRLLRYEAEPYDRSLLGAEMLRLEWEIGDEWSDGTGETPTAAPSVTLVLTYPHRRAGTLPLSFRTRGLFPASESGRSMVTLVDGRWGQRFSGWIVYDGRYIAGLENWYEQHKVPVGAYIVLERGTEPGEVVVDIRPRRMRREWARLARVDEGEVVFEMRKLPMACEYDELMVVDALDEESVAQLQTAADAAQTNLRGVLSTLVPELLKLNPEGQVHAKTVYSAVNTVRRTPPGPVFASLMDSRVYEARGGGYWSMA